MSNEPQPSLAEKEAPCTQEVRDEFRPPNEWYKFLAAVAFLTRIPVAQFIPLDHAETLKHCTTYFPLVGLLIGSFTASLMFVFGLFWPAWLVVLLALAGEALLTGAFHEDGLADFFDAFAGGWTRDDVLRILKDSRLGTYGTLALFFAVTIRGGAMYAIFVHYQPANPHFWIIAIVASAALARWMIVLTMVLIPPVSDRESISNEMSAQTTLKKILVSSLWIAPAVAVFTWFFPVQALAAALFLALMMWLLDRLIRRKIGGITGDCLGCIAYLSQVVILLAASMTFA